MTAQRPDNLKNCCEALCIDGLYLYGVIVGDTSSNHGWGEKYQFAHKATPNKGTLSTSLYRGYVSNYEITENGQLFLNSFEYPFEKSRPPDTVREQLVGDFWLVLKQNFFGGRTYIPFLKSHVVTDKSMWIFESASSNRSSIFQGFEKAYFKNNRCIVYVFFDEKTLGSKDNYKVYIDGNICSTHRKEESNPAKGIKVRVDANDHRIVVREFDASKMDRKESNTIHFGKQGNKTFNFYVALEDNQITLREQT